ncbi:MAG: FliM/FliN family flagellar motor switch protein [Gemmatimonadaceae bacterium]|jgi:flagellar motor switch protein FliM|nr:FliM/FliN family flagellar motor switch protein [Gemmatimonadaceae bacterium]
MASETLSQTDIDRLLGGGGAGGAAGPRGSGVDVQVYDFRRPARVSKERLRTLEAMYERLVKNLEAWVISRVRGQIEVRLQGVEQFSFGEFTLSLPTPCSSFIFEIGGTGQKGVIDIGPEFGFYVIDRVFGGTGQTNLPMRSLTPIERMAIRTVAERVTQLTEEIWQDHVPMELAVTGFESSPEILQVANREDPVLVANIEITAGGQSGLMLICLPFAVLDKFFTSSGQQRLALLASSEAEREEMRRKTETAVREMPVTVSVRLPKFELSLKDLLDLKSGTIIPTGIPKDARLLVRTGDQERYLGQAGRVSGNLAVRLVDHLSPSNG